MLRRWAAALAVIYLLVFIGLTLGGFYHPGASRNLVPFRTMEHDFHNGGQEFLINFVGNLVVTIPIGWFLPILLSRRCSAFKVGGFAMLLSVVVEILQGLSGQRVADIDDVILNTTGGLLGYASWLSVERIARRIRRSRHPIAE